MATKTYCDLCERELSERWYKVSVSDFHASGTRSEIVELDACDVCLKWFGEQGRYTSEYMDEVVYKIKKT